ncbi:MAG: NADH-quinone oxidoreductase subunit L [Vampirovibrionales bacterium]|nr:NADH-quinone oxidoreductase subunit L [Vampirovibrionales bacterium]
MSLETLALWFTQRPWLIPVYPLAAFLAIALIGGLFATSASPRIRAAARAGAMGATILATTLGLLHTLPLVAQLLSGALQTVEINAPWLQAGFFTISVGYLIDPLSVMMLLVVTFISLLIQIYTHGYMRHDDGYARFYGYLALFNFSMLGLVLSTNLVQMYIFWELVGVSSYLLIGFWFTRPAAAGAAVKAFLMNRVGDFGLLLGILTFLFFTWHWWVEWQIAAPGNAMLSFSGINALVAQHPAFLSAIPLTLIALLLFMGPMAKSAQVPLHTWLPDAMEGPTPISALIHAATMVAAGVYLVARLYPVFQLSPQAMSAVAIIGVITAVLAATIALTQTDIKKALAYSTCSQLGFMMAAMGCGAFAAGLFHLFTHAFFKAMLFLGSGSVIHACENEQDMRRMGGLLKKLPITGWTYLIGTVSISGLLLTSGFWSKDMILAGAQAYSAPIFWILTATAGVTAFYMFRTFFMTFLGAYRGEAHVHHESPSMVLPLVVLAAPSLLIGYLLSGQAGDIPSFASLIQPAIPVSGLSHHGGFSHEQIGWLSSLVALAGAALAAAFYWKPWTHVPHAIRSALSPVYTLFARKWYFDEAYNWLAQRAYLAIANASAAFDRHIVDGAVNLTGRSTMGAGGALRYLQTGRAQAYLTLLFLGMTALVVVLLAWR